MDMTVVIVTLIFGLVFGGGCGVYLARAGNSAAKRAKELDIELKHTREEFLAFKNQVTQHFSKTAELVNTLTANYREVYTHLVEGAQHFSSSDASKIASMGTNDPLLSSTAESTNVADDALDDQGTQETEDEGWYGDHPQEPVVDETARDDRFH
jgi:uncharacterized protein